MDQGSLIMLLFLYNNIIQMHMLMYMLVTMIVPSSMVLLLVLL
jgi:hypothetical protein